MEIIFFSSLCTSGRKLRSPNRNVHTGTVLYLRMYRTRTCKFLLEGTNLGASVRIPVSNKQRYPSVVSLLMGFRFFWLTIRRVILWHLPTSYLCTNLCIPTFVQHVGLKEKGLANCSVCRIFFRTVKIELTRTCRFLPFYEWVQVMTT